MKTSEPSKTIHVRGRERVKAWIYTVINPLLEALEVEAAFLGKHYWTWRFSQEDLEYILPLERYLDFMSHPNLDDFFDEHPNLHKTGRIHTQTRDRLSDRCQLAFHYLENLKTFREKVELCLDEYKKVRADDPGGGIPNKDFWKLAGQYVINDVRELPSHYDASIFWLQHGEKLLQYRKGKPFDALDAAGEEMLRSNSKLRGLLREARAKLIRKFDIPASPVPFHLSRSDS